MGRSKTEIIESALRYGAEVAKLFDDVEVRLFGSYHNGNSTKDSDIDLAIISPDFQNMDYLLTLKILNRLKISIDPEIEPIAITPEEMAHPQLGSISYEVAKNSELIHQF